jgi:hypothetical protein
MLGLRIKVHIFEQGKTNTEDMMYPIFFWNWDAPDLCFVLWPFDEHLWARPVTILWRILTQNCHTWDLWRINMDVFKSWSRKYELVI